MKKKQSLKQKVQQRKREGLRIARVCFNILKGCRKRERSSLDDDLSITYKGLYIEYQIANQGTLIVAYNDEDVLHCELDYETGTYTLDSVCLYVPGDWIKLLKEPQIQRKSLDQELDYRRKQEEKRRELRRIFGIE